MLLESPITIVLLVVNGLVAAYTMLVSPAAVDRLAFRPYAFYHDRQLWRLLTAGFVHAGVGHLFVNMFTLFFFGPAVEHLLGGAGFIVVYFGSDITANLATLIRYRDDRSYGAVGASGAISGVLFSYCLFAPLDMLYLMGVVPMPAIVFAVLFVGYSIYAARQLSDRVAHEAHLGGAIGGVVLTILIVPDAVMTFLRQLGL